MKIIEKLNRKLNDIFPEELKKYMENEHKCIIETKYSIINMTLISTKVDGTNFTENEKLAMAAFEAGYLQAMHTTI